jgi:hypothetical protein
MTMGHFYLGEIRKGLFFRGIISFPSFSAEWDIFLAMGHKNEPKELEIQYSVK